VAKLKKYIATAAFHVWTGRAYTSRDVCKILKDHTIYKKPSTLLAHLRKSAATKHIPEGCGTIAHHVPQFWYDFGNPHDASRCWHPMNVGIQPMLENQKDNWLLHVASIQNVPKEAFPLAYPKEVMLAAARHDSGRDLHSRHVLSRS